MACAGIFALTLHGALPLGLLPASALASLAWLAATAALRVIDRDEWRALVSGGSRQE